MKSLLIHDSSITLFDKRILTVGSKFYFADWTDFVWVIVKIMKDHVVVDRYNKELSRSDYEDNTEILMSTLVVNSAVHVVL